jgi:hypothetical protein
MPERRFSRYIGIDDSGAETPEASSRARHRSALELSG